MYHLAQITNNTTTLFTDSIPDSTLVTQGLYTVPASQPTAPTTTSAAGNWTLTQYNPISIGSFGVKFQNSSISGYNPTSINAYEESTGTWSSGVSSVLTFSNIPVVYNRINNQVTITFPDLSGTSNATPETIQLDPGTIPARFRPKTQKRYIVDVNSGGGVNYGTCFCNTNATMHREATLVQASQWSCTSASCFSMSWCK